MQVADTLQDMTEADCRNLDQMLAVEEERIASLQAVKQRISSSQADVSSLKVCRCQPQLRAAFKVCKCHPQLPATFFNANFSSFPVVRC